MTKKFSKPPSLHVEKKEKFHWMRPSIWKLPKTLSFWLIALNQQSDLMNRLDHNFWRERTRTTFFCFPPSHTFSPSSCSFAAYVANNDVASRPLWSDTFLQGRAVVSRSSFCLRMAQLSVMLPFWECFPFLFSFTHTTTQEFLPLEFGPLLQYKTRKSCPCIIKYDFLPRSGRLFPKTPSLP